MLPTFLSIDPGTRSTGIALFKDGELTHYASITAPASMPSYERIGLITNAVAAYHEQHGQEAATIACEKPPSAMVAHRPAPELDTLIRALRAWAKKLKGENIKRVQWTEYNPKTVAAAVAFRGFPHHPEGAKAHLQAGVTALYGHILTAPDAPISGDVPQDVIDAIAVGHCHLSALINAGVSK